MRGGARLAVLVAAVALLGASCTRIPTGTKKTALVVWGVFDDSDTMAPLIKSFTEQFPGVKVDYRKVSPVDTYEERLRQALAEQRGPDVFLFHASWMPRWKGALLPAPEKRVPVRAVHEEFVDSVSKDLIIDGRVLALPLFVDTLGLFYNKDIFNAAGVARPPRTWDEVHEVVRHVTQFNPDDLGHIDRSGIAIGTGRNVNRASDVLSALMIQNGAPMVDAGGLPAFGGDERAVTALLFYTDFANAAKDIYTWNLRSDYSLDAFAEGGAAMMVNYSYMMPRVREKNPRLNFAVAPLPQVELGNPDNPPKTYAGYWAYGVARQTTVPQEAWSFVRFITGTEPARGYLERSGYPPARRDLVTELQNDPRIGVFASQSLIGTTWPQPDSRVVDRVFTDAIDAVVSGQDTAADAIRRASEQISAAASAPR